MIKNEICSVLRGEWFAVTSGSATLKLWCAYADPELFFSGKPAEVDFDYKKVYSAEDESHDIAGFLHTHPGMSAAMSSQDKKTMRGWVAALDKELLCIIQGKTGSQVYIFDRKGHSRKGKLYSKRGMYCIILE